jgi:hypothetical protein
VIIYEKPNYIQVVYHPEKNYIIFDWTDFLVTLEEVKELFEKAMTVTQQHKCFYYLAETSRVTTMLRPEVIKWWADEWVAKGVAAGIQAIVTVVPKTALSAMSTHSWQAQVVSGITMLNAPSLEEAEKALKELQAQPAASTPG